MECHYKSKNFAAYSVTTTMETMYSTRRSSIYVTFANILQMKC